jgi:hypothetical protein
MIGFTPNSRFESKATTLRYRYFPLSHVNPHPAEFLTADCADNADTGGRFSDYPRHPRYLRLKNAFPPTFGCGLTPA